MMRQINNAYPPLAMDEVVRVFSENAHKSSQPINLGKGDSSFNPFDHVEIDLDHSLLANHTDYGDINGLCSLREAVCQYYYDKFGCTIHPAQVCITDGASGALNIVLAMLMQPYGELILADSFYPPYKMFAQMYGARCRFVPLKEDNNIDVERLPKFITSKTQAILVNSPNNPHGSVLAADELAAIADMGVPVIFDEVYQSLPLGDKTLPSAIHYADRHFILNSFSKSLAIAGFRLGYLIVPLEYAELMTNIKAILNMCTSLPSQIITEKLFNHWDDLTGKHRQMLTSNWQIFKRTADHLGLKLMSQPEAGFFATIDISETGQDSMGVALDLAQNHALSTVPGIDFRNIDPRFLRLNFACRSELIRPGLHKLAHYIKTSQARAKQSHIAHFNMAMPMMRYNALLGI